MLNSSYGKTIESIHDTKFNIMTEDTLTPYLRRNKNIIKSVQKIGDKYFVEENVEICD